MNGSISIRCQAVAALLLLIVFPGCSTYSAYRARFDGPNYTVTPEFFTRSPRRVAIFPFGTSSLKQKHLERAQICRVAFYQQFSVHDFEDVDMQVLDRRLLPTEEAQPRGLLLEFADTIRKLDVVGLTSFLDLKSLVEREECDTTTFRAWTRKAYEDLQADAYVLGIVRGYGRLYAVVFSSIGLATHVEMRAMDDDALLWCADFKETNIALPLTIDPLDLPILLFDIWKNSRGGSLDVLAFKVYRDVVRTLPAVRAGGPVHVRADRKKTRIFRHPTLWTFWPRPSVAQGTILRFLLERRGWVQCEGIDGVPVWMLCRDATLVDADGAPLEKTDPLGGLWKKNP